MPDTPGTPDITPRVPPPPTGRLPTATASRLTQEDLHPTAKVTKLAVTTSLAYFNPGCGAGESVALTQEGDEKLPGTRLVRLNAGTGAVDRGSVID